MTKRAKTQNTKKSTQKSYNFKRPPPPKSYTNFSSRPGFEKSESSKNEPVVKPKKMPFEKSENTKEKLESNSWFGFNSSAVKSITSTLFKYFSKHAGSGAIPEEILSIIKKAPGTVRMMINLGIIPPYIAMAIQPILTAIDSAT
jgi:hypothetical protein